MRIETKRLLIREFKKDDWKAVHSYASDPEVVRHMDFGPSTEEETKVYLNKMLNQQKLKECTEYDRAVILRRSEVLIGACGINITDPISKEGEIGYIFNSNHWGNGYASEACNAILEFGFRQLKLDRIFGICSVENKASERVLEKSLSYLEWGQSLDTPLFT